jgi:hypothetical protein
MPPIALSGLPGALTLNDDDYLWWFARLPSSVEKDVSRILFLNVPRRS